LMQSHVRDCEPNSGIQHTIAQSCAGDASKTVEPNALGPRDNDCALQSDNREIDANDSQVLGALLGLCQASANVSSGLSTVQIPSDSSICNWTKHFSLPELTSGSAEHSIFSPVSGPFPGDGPTVYQALDRHFGVSKQFQLPRGSVRVRPDLSIEDGSQPAVKRDRENSEDAPYLQTKTTDDAFMRRLLKMRHTISINSSKNDNSPGSGGSVAPLKLSKNNSSKQPCDSPFFLSNTTQERCCSTSDGAAPVVDIHVPSVCECGTVIVGVWYRNRPYYTHWFRHPRYAALRAMLEQNRCKNKYRPMCGVQPSAGLASPGGTCKDSVPSDSTTSFQDSVPSSGSFSEGASVEGSNTASITPHDAFGAVAASDDLLAPKFMSLLCMLQLVKHLDAVAFMYPSNSPDAAPHPNVALNHVKLSAHIDCERSKGFVQYRWYASDVDDLVQDLTSNDTTAKKVVGCCSLAHWRRKPPGRDSSKSVLLVPETRD